jgi:hypothetical protein
MRSLKDDMPVRLCDLCHGVIEDESVLQIFNQDLYEFAIICKPCYAKIHAFIEGLSASRGKGCE